MFITNSRHKMNCGDYYVDNTIVIRMMPVVGYLYSLGVAPSRISLPQIARASISFSPL